jgi:PAS domain S-box-containing protein
MLTKPTYKELEKRVAELEQKVDQHQTEAIKYQTLFNSFPYGITLSDEHGNVIESNKVAERLLGVNKGEHEKRKIDGKEWQIIRPDGTDMPTEEWASVIALKDKRLVSNCEMGIVKNNDEKIWLNVTAAPIPLKNNGVVVTYNNITERKQAEESLRKSEKKFRNLFENMLHEVHIWELVRDAYGNIKTWKLVDANPAALKSWGMTLSETVGKITDEIFPDSNGTELFMPIIKKIFAEGTPHIWETYIPDTNQILHMVSIPLGEYFISTGLDITDRKQSEEELRKKENQYSAIVENSGDYIMRYDKNHRHIFANRRAIESTGLPREQYLDKTHREMGFPEDLCILWEKNIDKVFSTGEIRKVDFDVELTDSWMSLELQLSPEFGKEGQVQSVIGVFRDVTERRAAQRDDKLNKARLEILHAIRYMDDASEKNICDMALEKMVELSGSDIGFLGFIVDSEQTMELHAWSASAMDECAIHDKPMTFPVDQAGLWGEPVRNRKSIIYNDYNLPHPAKKGYPEGHVPVIRFMSVPVFDGDTIVAVAAVANKSNPYDKIDQNQLELMMDSVWDLIQRSRMEKEKKMLVSQLQKVQKMESIGNLAGGIAHDFNNILFPIVGMSEMLLEDLPPDSLEWENVQEIFKAGKRGSELVKQILAFSRQNEHQLSPTRLQFIMKEVLKLSRSSIPTNIEISQHLQPDCGLVLADSTQLHQIGMNLITNAYHAVQDTDGKINVEVRELMINDESNDLKLPLGKYVALKVEDNGIGIKKEHLDKIFEPYFTTKEKGKGTGLGLSVVYGIVKEHKGDIKVKSEPGKGTCFEIYLPAMASMDDTEVATEHIHLDTGDENILLVDDELPILKLEKQILERLGYKVIEIITSPEALAVFNANPDAYDLVITDMSMPNLTGEKLAKELLRIRPDIPIIICTGFSESFKKENAKAAGIKGFLMKPVIKSDMAQMVRKVLDEAKIYKGN